MELEAVRLALQHQVKLEVVAMVAPWEITAQLLKAVQDQVGFDMTVRMAGMELGALVVQQGRLKMEPMA
ncbi:hypothetical protein SAMN04515695_0038 [Pseudovibrio sp. Tun.PSC04-5.I4]|nr:hypothetical protein SAMN04515695_0038 [Pseudovibrio sp. Tun.PSC04-5.I4]